jgi:hypothetical protein
MLGELTRGQPHTRDTTELMSTLQNLGRGDSDTAYIAKRLAVSVERRTLPDDVIDAMVIMTPNALMGMITRLTARNATIYDLPRHLIMLLAQRFAHSPKGHRALRL